MWLLDTARAELRFFSDPTRIPGGYAVLSHTWNGEEQTFQDVRAIHARCSAEGENPRDHVSEKIRNCCIQAERYGYEWVWVDSCCIDRESSTELSEAINSMFRWYVLAEVCFAHLEDVPFDDDIFAHDSAFRAARWHTRGWTLQELLAPAFLVFMSREWVRIATKLEIAPLLSEVTGVRKEYITRELSFHSHASIAERMHWASRRTTTRIEDEAYCLLGLFDINIPTLYGEGRRAFLRLQQELIKTSHDASILVWGGWHDRLDTPHPAISGQDMRTHFHGVMHTQRFFFAQSPRGFTRPTVSYSQDLYSNPDLSKLDALDLEWLRSEEVPTFEVTPLGMKCRFPVAEVGEISIAVLFCQSKGQNLGLLFHRAEEEGTVNRRTHYVSWAFEPGSGHYRLCRYAHLGHDHMALHFKGNLLRPTWRTIYIAASPRMDESGDPAARILSFRPDCRPPVPFRIPRWLISTLVSLDLIPTSGGPGASSSSSDPWRVWTQFTNTGTGEGVRLVLGICPSTTPGGASSHWAWAEPRTTDNWDGEGWKIREHDCHTDHIASWPGRTRDFGDSVRTVRLSFAPCAYLSSATLVLHMELLGERYDAMLRRTGSSIPPPPVRRTDVSGSTSTPKALGSLRPPSPSLVVLDGDSRKLPHKEEDPYDSVHNGRPSSTQKQKQKQKRRSTGHPEGPRLNRETLSSLGERQPPPSYPDATADSPTLTVAASPPIGANEANASRFIPLTANSDTRLQPDPPQLPNETMLLVPLRAEVSAPESRGTQPQRSLWSRLALVTALGRSGGNSATSESTGATKRPTRAQRDV